MSPFFCHIPSSRVAANTLSFCANQKKAPLQAPRVSLLFEWQPHARILELGLGSAFLCPAWPGIFVQNTDHTTIHSGLEEQQPSALRDLRKEDTHKQIWVSH